MFLRIQVFQGPDFLDFKFFRVQVLEVALKLLMALNFLLLRHHICFQFFFFKCHRKKIYAPTLTVALVFIYVMIFVFREVFLIHNYLVTQKISYYEIIYQSSKRRMCVNFLKYSINFFSTNFIFIDVRRKRS